MTTNPTVGVDEVSRPDQKGREMATLAVRRDITGDDVATAVTERLGPHYRAQLGTSLFRGFGHLHEPGDDHIDVSTGPGRFSRTRVPIERRDDSSAFRTRTPGPFQLRLRNAAMADRVRQALAATPGLGGR